MSHYISRRQFIKSSIAGTAALSAACRTDSRQPNILFIFSDQQHWQTMQHVNSFFRTPHLTELSRHSVRFRQAICTTPQCSPSRSSMLTGYYPHKTGVMGNTICISRQMRNSTI
ncbi:MAG: sulfatase-like hydrolase/transferase [candidate division KSB1 bacterium]|nr:sulfatase-like hydrolase/transferase [candidate division KSB1 bacterium]